MKYEFTSDMAEISGFGGGYEAACRRMLQAGLLWLDENPEAEPQFHGYKGVYGIIREDNDAAKGLTKVIIGACPDATGAMHQAVVSHCLYVRKNGWDKYVETMRKTVNTGPDRDKEYV